MIVRIPAGKLGTVRIDRTVDVYSTSITYDQNVLNPKLCTPTIAKTSSSSIEQSSDEDLSDIAVIYSLVRRASTRRASSPRLAVLPLPTSNDNSSPLTIKSYTLEPPLTPSIIHKSKEAQIKIIPSISSNEPTATNSINNNSLTTRIQTSNSFTSHDRPSVPLVTVKPRPYSFRTTGRNVIERQISQITERFSQLHESFLSRLSVTPNRQRNRSHSTCHDSIISTDFQQVPLHSIKRRPKSEIFDDRKLKDSGRIRKARDDGVSFVRFISRFLTFLELFLTFQCHCTISYDCCTNADRWKSCFSFCFVLSISSSLIFVNFKRINLFYFNINFLCFSRILRSIDSSESS